MIKQQTSGQTLGNYFDNSTKIIQLHPKNDKSDKKDLNRYIMLGVQDFFLDRLKNILTLRSSEYKEKIQYEIDSVRNHYAELMISGKFSEASIDSYKIISLFNSKKGGINWDNKYKKEFRKKAEIAAEVAAKIAKIKSKK